MLDFTNNVARQWFHNHGTTLDDARSFRIMIEQVQEEIDFWTKMMTAIAIADDKLAWGLTKEIVAANELANEMRERLGWIVTEGVQS